MLRTCWAKISLEAIAAKLRKSSERFRRRVKRLGLEVVDLKGFRTTTSLVALDDLFSLEETLKLLVGALYATKPSGLNRFEFQQGPSHHNAC